MPKRRVLTVSILMLLIAFFTACSSKPSSGQLMMDVTGETFTFIKQGTFTKNHDFWVFKIRDVEVSGTQKSTIGVKDARVETRSKGLGFRLVDPAGYEWDVISLAELQTGRRQGQSRKEKNVISYVFSGRMEEKNTMVVRRIRAEYTPSNPAFDGSLRGDVTNEKGEVIYSFESNPRLDVQEKPDDGLQVFSISINDETVAVLDSRNGYEVTFFEGLQPTQRTQLAGTLSSLFVLMRYGVM